MNVFKYQAALHAIPESSFHEIKTSRYISDVLSNIGLTPIAICKTGTYCFFDYGKPHTILIRADIDAVGNGKNVAHLCGHDAHSAILLQLAQNLATRQVAGCNIILLWQMGEEKGAGAKKIINSELFKKFNIAHIYGLHLYPQLLPGQIGLNDSVLMAASSEFEFTLNSLQYHISDKSKTHPLDIFFRFFHCAERAALKLKAIIGIGQINGGTAINATPARIVARGSIRAHENQIVSTLIKTITKLGAKFNVHCSFQFNYPCVKNDILLVNKMQQIFPEQIKIMPPLYLAEDFGNYSLKAPSCFFFLGCQDEISTGLHQENFHFPSVVLQMGINIWERIINSYE